MKVTFSMTSSWHTGHNNNRILTKSHSILVSKPHHQCFFIAKTTQKSADNNDMASEHSPLLPGTESNNYTPLGREREIYQQNSSPRETVKNVNSDYETSNENSEYLHFPQDRITSSVDSSDDDVKLLTDSGSFMQHSTTWVQLWLAVKTNEIVQCVW